MALFALGSNGSGQLGITHKEDVSVPKPALFHPAPTTLSISRLAAGGNHTLLLFESGELYWSGDPSSGACGLTSSTPQQSVFRPVQLAPEGRHLPDGTVVDVAATWEASIIVRREGASTAVYTLGAGPKGELGLGALPAEILRTPTATRIPDFPPEGTRVAGLSACMSHVVAVLDNGDVYGWGNGRKGQLGEPAEVVKAPRKLASVTFPVKRAVTGREFTCLVSAPEIGKIAVLGSDKWGIKSDAPETARGWKDVGASWGNVYILSEGGQLTSWGRDDHGQMVPPGLPAVSKLAVGSEHVVCLLEEGEVVSWGWGEHGNCGPTADVDVKGRWNAIASVKFMPEGLRISGVGAGCATSWVIITAG